VERRKISGPEYWRSIFGPAEGVRGSENDLFACAKRLKASDKPIPDIYMWCGTSDFLYQQNVRMRDHLTKLGYPLTYRESAGNHNWMCWDEHIQDVLNWLVK
jgi:putative tributyrin esterase